MTIQTPGTTDSERAMTSDPHDRPLLAAGEAIAPLRLTPELEASRALAADPDEHLDERLEAYEDIMESEVGDTDLVRARNVERRTGLRQLFLKFEGGNPSGTQKDRIAFAQVQDALRRNFDTLTLATCGNYGVAVAQAASFAGLRCEVLIPERYHTPRIREIERLGATIVRVPGDYEHAVELSQQRAGEREQYDANPGGANLTLQLKAYAEIAYEIYDVLRDAPAVVAVPVSNGTTLAGIHRGFVSLLRRGKTSRIPRMVAGSAYRMNPIVPAWQKGLDSCDDLAPERIHETRVNEPLVNWHAIDGDHALRALHGTQGWATCAGDRRMLAHAQLLREEQGLNVLPASTAGLIALLDRHASEPLPGDRYVAILTGRNA
jgi:threonine synthase